MYPLHIALHDGFQNHSVTVLIDGRQVYRKASVSTDLTISRADAFDTQAEATPHIEVAVEPGGARAAIDVKAVETPFVAIELSRDGKLLLRPSKTEFLYQ
ncbi:MAG: hypothetical protein HY820_19775 [Acidobacteria bacterium]|nr:hypothetical protein [Acidobacteriota bacterium]